MAQDTPLIIPDNISIPQGALTDKKDVAELVGKEIAKRSIDKGIKAVAFDKGKYKYHGLIKIFADSARNAGLEF